MTDALQYTAPERALRSLRPSLDPIARTWSFAPLPEMTMDATWKAAGAAHVYCIHRTQRRFPSDVRQHFRQLAAALARFHDATHDALMAEHPEAVA